MNTAQLASNILQAWRYQDRSRLGTALDSASNSCTGTRAGSNLEIEREEMLQSIVEHLRQLANQDQLPDPSKSNGALTLLSHLSSAVPARDPEPANLPLSSQKG
jgi:hypothetical protein